MRNEAPSAPMAERTVKLSKVNDLQIPQGSTRLRFIVPTDTAIQPRSQGFSLLRGAVGDHPHEKGKSPGNEVDSDPVW